jgi:hypothetical protein
MDPISEIPDEESLHRRRHADNVTGAAIALSRLARGAVLAFLVALATVDGVAGQALAPLVIGWERFFTLTWEAWQDRGQPMVGGYVKNEAGFPARRVQLLVEALDASGRVTGQRVDWLGSDLTPGMRAYFEAPAPAPAATYRVSVFAYDWVQSAHIQAP